MTPTTNSGEELRGCPWCNRNPEKPVFLTEGPMPGTRCSIRNCPGYLYHVVPVDDWNTRPVEDQLAEQVRVAEDELVWLLENGPKEHSDRIAEALGAIAFLRFPASTQKVAQMDAIQAGKK